MAYSALACPAVRELLQAVEKDFNLSNLADKYLGTPVPVLSTDSETPAPAVPVQSHGTVTPPPPKKKKGVPKEACGGKTAKGDPCKFAVKCDGLCGIHLRQRDQPSVKKTSTVAKVAKKVRKEAPQHSHPAEESDPTCGLCEDQGNVVVPELTKAEFEAVEEEGQSIQDRLRAILSAADEDPEDPEEVAEADEAPLDSFDQMKAALERCEAEDPEDPEEDPEDVSMKVKLARLLAEEDDDVEDEDDAEDLIQQMSETPPSKAKVAAFEELLAEMES